MNYLVLHPEHFQEQVYIYQDALARELVKQHELREGIEISAILYGQSRGIAKIQTLQRNYLEVSYTPSAAQVAKTANRLIVGVSRPQTVKKVLQAGQVLGVQEIIFVMSSNSEKSYLQATIWEPNNLRAELTLGMAQSGDYLEPIVRVLPRFSQVVKELSEQHEYRNLTKYIASTRSAETTVMACSDHGVLLAIGAEKGWTESEEQELINLNFQPISFGSRILRVEQAVLFGLGRLS